MNETLGLVNNTIKFSVVDGPGNRFVIFLQGCDFNCVTCHNPYTITQCTSCGICIEPCPEDALTLGDDSLILLDRALCTECDICIDVCPIDSTPLARSVTVEELLNEIRPVAPFIAGVTVSGGEATLQSGFVTELFTSIKNADELSHLTTFVDSNGSAETAVWDELADVTDGVMIDLKALDPDTHMSLTGSKNTNVLTSIEHLASIDKLYEVRLLIVPGYNDDPETMRRTSSWLYGIDQAMRVKLIGYRPHGVRREAEHIEQSTPELLALCENVAMEIGLTNIMVV